MKTNKKGFSGLRWLVLMVGLFLMFPSLGHALNWTLDTEFSGTGATATGYPEVTLTGSGTVQLTIQSNFTVGSGEYIEAIYLNLNPAFAATNLSFSLVSGDAATVSLGTDAFKADGDGKYDILLSYPTAPLSARFWNNDQSVYDITCALCSGLSDGSFNFLSAPAGGHGPFYAVAKMQGLGEGNNYSGWFRPGDGEQVPEPSTLLLLGSGLVGLGLWGRKRLKS